MLYHYYDAVTGRYTRSSVAGSRSSTWRPANATPLAPSPDFEEPTFGPDGWYDAAAPAPSEVSINSYFDRFTPDEAVAIMESQLGAVIFQRDRLKNSLNGLIDLKEPKVHEGLDVLIVHGLLETHRKAEILGEYA